MTVYRTHASAVAALARRPTRRGEYGRAWLRVDRMSPLIEGIWEVGDYVPVLMSHGDRVTKLPPGFEVVAHGVPDIEVPEAARKKYT